MTTKICFNILVFFFSVYIRILRFQMKLCALFGHQEVTIMSIYLWSLNKMDIIMFSGHNHGGSAVE